MDILAIGEILIDLTQTGVNENGVRSYAANPGGAPANVAVAAARLGAETGFVGKVGKDAFGDDLQHVLEANGVHADGLFRTEEDQTTVAVVSVNESGERSFSFYRSPGADTLLTTEEALSVLEHMPASPIFLHFGSVSLTADPEKTATLELAAAARKAGSLVSYDPNYRSTLWPGEEAAIPAMRAPLPMVDVLKISDEELLLITGSENLEEGTAAMCALGIRLVLVTLGSNGVYYRMGEATGHIPGFSVKVADTNGAGDAFFGAVLSRLAQRKEPLELSVEELEHELRFANKAAALTCSRSGAIPAMPKLQEVLASLEADC